MQSYPKEIWDELKEITILDLIRALEKDGFREDDHEGATRIYIKKDPVTLVVSINCSNISRKCGPRMLKGIIKDIGWSLDDLRRLSLIR